MAKMLLASGGVLLPLLCPLVCAADIVVVLQAYLQLCTATVASGVLTRVSLACRYVASGPLVRSSYRAGEFFVEAMIKDHAAAAKK
jgi:hypothetical protein